MFFFWFARFNIGVARFWFQYDSASSTEFLSCKLTHFTAHSQLTCIVRQELAQFVFCQETWESPVAQDCSTRSAKTHAKSESERERERDWERKQKETGKTKESEISRDGKRERERERERMREIERGKRREKRERERERDWEIEREREGDRDKTKGRGESWIKQFSCQGHCPTALPRNHPSSTSAPNAAPASLVRTKPSRLMSRELMWTASCEGWSTQGWRRRRRHVKFMFVSQVLGPQNSGAHVSCLVLSMSQQPQWQHDNIKKWLTVLDKV